MSGFSSGIVSQIQAGENVEVDSTNAARPKISATGGGGGGGALAPFRGARITQSATQTYSTTSAWFDMRFDTEVFDTDDLWDATNPNQFTVPEGVTKVELIGLVQGINMTTVPSNQFIFWKNSSSLDAVNQLTSSGYSNPGLQISTGPVDVVAGDILRLRGYLSASAQIARASMVIKILEFTNTNARTRDLLDVTATAPQDGQVLVYDAASSKYVPGTPQVAIPQDQGLNKSFKGAMVRWSADKSLTAPVLPVSWDAAMYDTDSFWSVASPSRFTIPAGVTKIRLMARIGFAAGQATKGNGRVVQFMKNGAIGAEPGVAGTSDATGYTDGGASAITPVLQVQAGDYFEVRYNTQESGAKTYANASSFFSIEVLETTEVV